MLNLRFSAVLIIASALSAGAQNLKTEITVDRTVVPVEREATRIGSLSPQLMSSPVKSRRLELVDFTDASEITRSASTLAPASYADTFALSPYRGYASAGYFPTFNLAASAGYKFIDKRDMSLGAWLQYDGFSYKPSKDSEKEGHYKNNTVKLGAEFNRRVGRESVFSSRVAYSYAAVGMPDNPFLYYSKQSQTANAFDLDLSWWSRMSAVVYHANASFSHFGYGKDIPAATVAGGDFTNPFIKPASENRYTVTGGLAYLSSSPVPRAGIEIAADFLSRSNGVEYIYVPINPNGTDVRHQPITDSTLGVITLSPYYAFNNGNVHSHIGAKIEVSTGGEGKKFHIAPAIMLDWNAMPQLAVYANISGGEHLNSLRSLYDYCPFMSVSGAWQYQRSHIPVSADFGVNIGPFTGFSARIFGGYAVANDWLMPQSASLWAKDGQTYFNGYNFDVCDLKGWHAGVGFSYEWRSIVKADISAETAPNDLDKAYYMWRDRAKYVVKASVDVRPVDRLKIGMAYELRADRRNYIYNLNDLIPVNIKNVSVLNLNASYSVNDALTVFVNCENMLDRRYYLVSGIESQGIKGLIGAAYKF